MGDGAADQVDLRAQPAMPARRRGRRRAATAAPPARCATCREDRGHAAAVAAERWLPRQSGRRLGRHGSGHDRCRARHHARQGVDARGIRSPGSRHLGHLRRQVGAHHRAASCPPRRRDLPDPATSLRRTIRTRAGDSLHVRVHPVAGKYAFTLATPDKLAPAAQATFSYAIHFRTPARGQREVSRRPAPLEQALAPALLGRRQQGAVSRRNASGGRRGALSGGDGRELRPRGVRVNSMLRAVPCGNAAMATPGCR